jgi:hypothetical protein
MNDEERNNEIREIKTLLLEVQTAARRQMEELERLRDPLAKLTGSSQQVEAIEGGGEGLTRGGEFIGEGAGT